MEAHYNMEKTKIYKKGVRISRKKLKHGLIEDRYIHEKIMDKRFISRDYYMPIVQLLSNMIDKNME